MGKKKGKKEKKIVMSFGDFQDQMGPSRRKDELPDAPTGLEIRRGHRGGYNLPRNNRRRDDDNREWRRNKNSRYDDDRDDNSHWRRNKNKFDDDREDPDRRRERMSRRNDYDDDRSPRREREPSRAEQSGNWRSSKNFIDSAPKREYRPRRDDRSQDDREERKPRSPSRADGDRQWRKPSKSTREPEQRRRDPERKPRPRQQSERSEVQDDWRKSGPKKQPVKKEPDENGWNDASAWGKKKTWGDNDDWGAEENAWRKPKKAEPEPEPVVEQKNDLSVAMEEGVSVSVEVLTDNISKINLKDEYERSCLARSIALSLDEGNFNFEQASGIIGGLNVHSAEVFEGLFVELLKNNGAEGLFQIVSESGLNPIELLGLGDLEDAELENELAQRRLTALLSTPEPEVEEVVEIEEKVEDFSFDADASGEEVFAVISAAIEKNELEIPLIASAGQHMFSRFFASGQDQASLDEFKSGIELLNESTNPVKLRFFIDGLTTAWVDAGMPKKRAGKKAFQYLSEISNLNPEAFLEWRDAEDNKGESKKKMLVQVSSVLFEIEQIYLSEKYGYDDEEEEEEEFEYE